MMGLPFARLWGACFYPAPRCTSKVFSFFSLLLDFVVKESKNCSRTQNKIGLCLVWIGVKPGRDLNHDCREPQITPREVLRYTELGVVYQTVFCKWFNDSFPGMGEPKTGAKVHFI